MFNQLRAKSGWLAGTNPTVAIVSKSIIIVFVLFAALMTDTASEWFTYIKDGILFSLKWYYIIIVAGFLFFVIGLLFSPYGNIRLGQDDDRPSFSYFSWFAMLFSAGMGIGLIFWSIAEPIYHFHSNPFVTEGLTPEAAQVAMRITFFHWGLHPWAIFVLTGLVLAYFAYRKGLPLTIRSSLYPLIGDRIYGGWGHAADILAIFATVFGVATSLGLGVQQINAGLNHLFGMEISPLNQLVLIAIITAIATLSVVSGVNRGVKILSEVNVWLSLAILILFLAFGPTRYLLNLYVQSLGDYMSNLIPMSLWTDANKDRVWQDWWTAFYWGWWISWAPFVGMFIARISKGRTIREFILGVLLVPTLISFIWLVAFGGTALHLELTHQATNAGGELVAAIGQAGIVDTVVTQNNTTLALYSTIEQMNLGWWLGNLVAILATMLVATYFITSSDSGTLVVNTILSVGNEEPPMPHRIFWGITEGLVAGVLLLAGGLKALQTAAITAALPFSIVMLLMTYGLIKALRAERRVTHTT